jgi:hypothetical protein
VAATYGAICILQPFTVDQASSGHIGFLHAVDATNVWLLSGNSKNQVRISAYPKSKLIHNAPLSLGVLRGRGAGLGSTAGSGGVVAVIASVSEFSGLTVSGAILRMS